MSKELVFGILFFIAGASSLIWARQIHTFAASRSLWEWHRRATLSSISVMMTRVVGAILMACSAYVIWLVS
jgi:hypothetical protein